MKSANARGTLALEANHVGEALDEHSDIGIDRMQATPPGAKGEIPPRLRIRRGASKGVLAHLKCDPQVSDDESLLDAIEEDRRSDPQADRCSVAKVLSEIPNAGEDEDFARVQ